MAEKSMPVSAIEAFAHVPVPQVDDMLEERLARFGRTVVVLDDDPTGVQTVHGVYVYTDWSQATLEKAFLDGNDLFFVLTNSRAFSAADTRAAHLQIGERLARASQKTGKPFCLVSRADSTLRGHWPLETASLRTAIERNTGIRYDGEIILPFFAEGGRYTMGNVHYVEEAGRLVPAGQTEFAKDKTFGYTTSDLTEWCAEKSPGIRARDVVTVSIEELRSLDLTGVTQKLLAVRDFGKVVVNAVSYTDVKLFAIAYLDALARGKDFLWRSAAAVPKVLGGITDIPLLKKGDLVTRGVTNGGVVLVGSHVQKTTRQLECLRQSSALLAWLEFDQHQVLRPGGLNDEVARVVAAAEACIQGGRTAVVYTRRERLDIPGDRERQLRVSVQISDAVTSIIGHLRVQPRFIIAKGGITSSDVGTKALRVWRAQVAGQVQPGIPVWKTGPESKFPGMPYIIFPGNVGRDASLREIVDALM